MRVKQTDQKEIGRVKLSDTQGVVVSMIDNERLDLRVWIKTDGYSGTTKRGVGFYLFDDNWEEFMKLMKEVDKACQELA